MKKKLKRAVIISVFTFLVINTVAYAANIDIYDGIVRGITAVKDAIIKKDSGIKENTDEAMAKLDAYIENYHQAMKQELEAYKAQKSTIAKSKITNDIYATMQRLQQEQSQIIAYGKAEIDAHIQEEMDKEYERINKKYNKK